MKDLEKFLKYISKLKLTARTGWKMRDVPGVKETIASHSFGTVFIAWIMAKKKKVDVNKTVKMALIHDLLEGIIGDITPYDKNYQIKEILEKEAINKLEKLLPEELKVDVKNLIDELIEGKTKESQIVIQADKLDTAFQAYIYEKEKYGKNIENSDLTEFFDSIEKVCKEGFSKEFLDYIKNLRGK